ncbi:Integrator complex subunit 7 [Batrachochytrium dendrobatidis]|nr:Integrator complex subunit 7 [Batrachochytrium dendrobatidis]KAK5665937.1 Integrator complex subunit 7 [Batrachochytrium dendrobatidis]
MAQDNDWLGGGQRWLLDTDTAWRSTKVDLRVEALLMLPVHLAQSPLPTVLKSAFLKLSEYWRSCTNDMRVVLAMIICKCARHISCIDDTDDIIRRILGVVGSNDPLARSLSLLVLGHLSYAIRNRSEVQDRVLKELARPTPREIAAGVSAVDRIWSVKTKTVSVASLSILGESIRYAQGLDDQGNLSLRLAHIFRNCDQDFHQAITALKICTSLSIDPCISTSLSAQSAALRRTITVLSIQFPAFLPNHINNLVNMLHQGNPHNDLIMDVLGNILILSKAHSHHFEAHHLPIIANIMLFSFKTGSPLRMCKITARILKFLSLGEMLFLDAIQTHALAKPISAAMVAMASSNIIYSHVTSALLDLTSLASSIFKGLVNLKDKKEFEQVAFNLASRIIIICGKSENDHTQLYPYISSVWNLYSILQPDHKTFVFVQVAELKHALDVLAAIWTHDFDQSSIVEFSKLILDYLKKSSFQQTRPKHMLRLVQVLWAYQDLLDVDRLSETSKVLESIMLWLRLQKGGCWWIVNIIQLQLIEGVTVSGVEAVEGMMNQIDVPVVVCWLKMLQHFAHAVSTLGHHHTDQLSNIKSARLSLEEALVQLHLAGSLGVSRTFQIAYIQLLLQLLYLLPRIMQLWVFANQPFQKNGICESGIFAKIQSDAYALAEQWKALSRDYFCMDRNSENIIAFYRTIVQALADSCSLHTNGPENFHSSLVSRLYQLREVHEQSSIGKKINRFLARLQAVPVNNSVSAALNSMFFLRPTPKFFFNSLQPLEFKLQVTPLPKSGHSLALRRKTIFVLQLEGFASLKHDLDYSSDGALMYNKKRMNVCFTITAVSQTGMQVAHTVAICHIKQPAGYFATSCSLSTDDLPERFQVFVNSMLESIDVKESPMKKSWRIADPVCIPVRLINE